MSEKLRNCPFCGGSNTASYLTDFGDLRMYCINCYEDGNGLAHNSDTWNTRPIEDELQRRIAELTAENAALREQVRWRKYPEEMPELNKWYWTDYGCWCEYVFDRWEDINHAEAPVRLYIDLLVALDNPPFPPEGE